MPTIIFIYDRWQRAVTLGKIGKGVFSKIMNQLTESEKDEIEFLSKHFQDNEVISNSKKNDAMKVFWICVLKDVGRKGLKKKVKHFRDKEKVVWRNVYQSTRKEQSNTCTIFGLSKDK